MKNTIWITAIIGLCVTACGDSSESAEAQTPEQIEVESSKKKMEASIEKIKKEAEELKEAMSEVEEAFED